MNINYSTEELWLDPSNYLMLCSNIKRSLINYNENVKSENEVNETHYKVGMEIRNTIKKLEGTKPDKRLKELEKINNLSEILEYCVIIQTSL